MFSSSSIPSLLLLRRNPRPSHRWSKKEAQLLCFGDDKPTKSDLEQGSAITGPIGKECVDLWACGLGLQFSRCATVHEFSAVLRSTAYIFTCGIDICHCRQIYSGMVKDPCEIDHICYDGHGDSCDCSNILDADWLFSSANSCEEEVLQRSAYRSASFSSENIVNEGRITETTMKIMFNLAAYWCEYDMISMLRHV
ncbi:hypothetical protein RIF29_34490 [Crotalaria pallida]|uniref:Uncharacterized protein n=1 Tax=Crotalaria pallida TaxID=3830 RepID=A0AAN9E9G9_CROPI